MEKHKSVSDIMGFAVVDWDDNVQNDEHFGRDCPVVQVGDVALKDELQCTDGTHLVLVLAMQTLEKI